MNEKQSSLAWGITIGALVVWWICRRRGLVIGSSGLMASGAGCGCGGSALSAEEARHCPPQGQTSHLYLQGYSQAPVASNSGPYLVSTVQPVIAPTVIARPSPVYVRYGSVQDDRASMYGYGKLVA